MIRALKTRIFAAGELNVAGISLKLWKQGASLLRRSSAVLEIVRTESVKLIQRKTFAGHYSKSRKQWAETTEIVEEIVEIETEEKQGPRPGPMSRVRFEALIFVADEPISTRLLAEVLDEERDLIESVIEEVGRIIRENAAAGCRSPDRRWLADIRREPNVTKMSVVSSKHGLRQKLSLASLETLAVIAYKQPVTSAGDIGNSRRPIQLQPSKTLLEKTA
jgi:hypothetical protein